MKCSWLHICALIGVISVLCLAGVFDQLQIDWNKSLANLTDYGDYDDYIQDSSLEDAGDSMIVITLPRQSEREVELKQIAPPANPIKEVTSRLPCSCKEGVCACCTGMLLQALRSKGCMNLKYIADDFAFIFEMKMNNQVLYKNRVSGRNPRPICVNPPRFPFIEVCATFYDVYFFGRNVHACMEFGGYFQGYQLFTRSFDCLRMGSQGVRIVKPEDDIGPARPGAGNGTEAIIDAGDGIEDYDDNLIRDDAEIFPTTNLPIVAPVVSAPVGTTKAPPTVKKTKPPARKTKPTTTTRKPVKRKDSEEEDDDDEDEDEEEDSDEYFF